MKKLSYDLSALTNIPVFTMNKLIDKSILCICHGVHEGIIEKNNPVEVDIGIGVMYINYEEDEIKYKFIPSKKLEESVAKTVSTNISPLTAAAEEELKERVEATYKNLL